MKTSNIIEYERNQINELSKYQLPNRFKTIGMAILILSFLGLISIVFMSETNELITEISKKGILIGMLLISISKDKIEDEMTAALRSKSYSIAFISGVLYTLIMPYVDYSVSSVVNSGGEVLKDLGDFQILIFMLMIQLLFFHTLTRAS